MTTQKVSRFIANMATQKVSRFIKFILERQRIYELKEAGAPKPWTKDKILQQYSFCNVYREQDRVTKWIAEHWRNPHNSDQHLWFGMTLARLINWPDTLKILGYPDPWDAKWFINVVRKIMQDGGKAWGGAYIVSTNGQKMQKEQYIAQCVLQPLWNDRKKIAARFDGTLQTMHTVLSEYQGMGSFMAAQVVADVKYTKPYRKAPDWWTFAASGPGSRRGLNRVRGRPVNSPWREEAWLADLRQLGPLVDYIIHQRNSLPRIHLQDLQNCLCEFDKYERTRLGEGRPRATYPGAN